MKNISEMTIKEIEDEIKMAKFDANENYVFVSYSHMDYKQVYPMVLRWINDDKSIEVCIMSACCMLLQRELLLQLSIYA